ncbi:DedA family protein [Streptomyces sp. TRM66268-LWL]|uniref:DedA family protein n=1 Tax=Streptomyces polyasparticus TaxID=2767826 RepID=A0ABR7S687_9ACTN|nr:DedA family protein [Streptomyces polyasparticus]
MIVLTVVPPLVPNSWLLMTAGALSATGRLHLPAVLLVAVCSAVLGDLLIYGSARRFGGGLVRLLNRGPRRRLALEWAAARIERYGIPFMIAARFAPSGRTVGMSAAGLVRFPSRRMLCASGAAESVWVAYTVGLGYFGGAAAGEGPLGVLIGLAISGTVGALLATARWVMRRRGGAAASRVVTCGETLRADAALQAGPKAGARAD